MQERELTEQEKFQLQQLSGAYGLSFMTELSNYTSLPLSLLPTSLNRQKFNNLLSATSLFSDLMYKVHLKPDFLFQHLKNVYNVDDFTRRLIEIAKKASIPNKFVGITRNDFFMDEAVNEFKQVQFNTIAAGFCSLSQKTSEFHKHALAKLGIQEKVLENKSGQSLTEALAKSHQLYGSRGKILFLITKPQINYFDQGYIEVDLWKNFGILVERASLLQVAEYGSLGVNKELLYKGQQISTVYFRAGYIPDHYSGQLDWQAREMMELSTAIKIPNVFFHLAGTKKVQQVLFSVDIMSEFIQREKAEFLKSFLVGIWGLDEIDYELVERIRMSPDRYVLKPQREGGGNNIYGEDILAYFENVEDDRGVRQRLMEFIVMEKIQAQQCSTYASKAGEVQFIQAISQIGIFGVHVVQDGEVLENKYGGYLVRTKAVETNQGGIAAGFSTSNSICLEG